MPNLRNILSDVADTSIATSDGDIHIEYYPSRVTQKVANQFQTLGNKASSSNEIEEQEETRQKLYSLILHLIKSWDLEDEIPCGKCEICKSHDEEECQSKRTVPFPLRADRLEELPVWLLLEIMEKLVSPNQKAPQKRKKS